MRFTKMQGLGNDYIFIDCTKAVPEGLPQLARTLSQPHFGVGSDGLICILPSETADVRMRMFNADGSEGEMCGNGLRCLCKFVYEKGLVLKKQLEVETLAGIKRALLHLEGGQVAAVTVDMGEPVVEPTYPLCVGGREYMVTPVSMGNPHLVTFLEELDSLDLATLGPGFEFHPRFMPRRINTEFVTVQDGSNLQVRVWERGSGETLACGTGACAVLAAAVVTGRSMGEAQVSLPGGALSVRWSGEDGHIYMTGPAVTVFEGEMNQ